MLFQSQVQIVAFFPAAGAACTLLITALPAALVLTLFDFECCVAAGGGCWSCCCSDSDEVELLQAALVAALTKKRAAAKQKQRAVIKVSSVHEHGLGSSVAARLLACHQLCLPHTCLHTSVVTVDCWPS